MPDEPIINNEEIPKFTQEEWNAKYNDEGGWRDTLPEDLATNSAMSKFKTPADVVKGYINLEKGFGDRIPAPKENFTKQEWDEYNKKYTPGYPETADGYTKELDLGDYVVDESRLENFRQWAHTNGLSDAQQQRMAKHIFGREAEQHNTRMEEMKQRVKDQQAELKKKYGAAYESKITAAQNGIRASFPPDYIENVLKKQFLDTAFIEGMVKIGENLSEDKLETNSKPKSVLTPREAQSKFNEFQQKHAEILRNKRHPQHQEMLARRNELAQMAWRDEE